MMTKEDFLEDINSEFNFNGFVLNSLSDSLEGRKGMDLVSFYRPLRGRGRDQAICIAAHYLRWARHGTTVSYCHECPFFFKMLCMESHGFSEECTRGHWRFEAT